MSTFRLYLWKEWREQRAALAALALILLLLVLAVGLSLPRRVVADSSFVGAFSALALITMLLVVGGEILSTDRRRGAWLERLPRGLEGAFPAKLVLFGGLSLLALLLGHGLGTSMALARGREHFLDSLEHDGGLLRELAPGGLALVLASWTFASSAWCARSMLALAAGALLAGGFAYPLWALDALGYRPARWELAAAVTLCVGGALTSAWVGFARAQRFGRGLGAVALRGGGTGVLALAPLWGWSFVQLEARGRTDLGSPDCVIDMVWVSADATVAVLEARMVQERWRDQPSSRAFWIDLEHGQARDLGTEWPVFHRCGIDLEFPGLARYEALQMSNSEGRESYFDARTGQPVLRSSAPEADTLMIEAAGHGWSYQDDHGRVFHDPYADVEVHSQELGLGLSDSIWIGPERWLIHGAEWLEYDPHDGSLAPADWLASALVPVALLADGRLLAVLGSAELALIDPRTREFQPIAGFPEDWRLTLGGAELQAADELILGDGVGCYRLDIECRELVPLEIDPHDQLVRRLADGDLVILTDEGFVRREAEDGTRHTLVRFAELVTTEVAP